MVEIIEELKKLVEEHALGFATIDASGKPHNIAVGDVKVVSKNQLIIGDVYLVETIKNIQKNNSVSLVVWNKGWEENCIGYELQGTAEHFSEGEWVEKAKKIHEGFPVKGAIIVTLNKIKKLAVGNP
ncbi:pyridoxamine 5'-phosphate oxidase family protein [Candidatus Woesearchaeota archaeon]|nr:pyridoxamine 5'-phosphate oxidase family protein [Candidatus Woesearchaeota archaeon]MBW3005678.1 pyridoxamine 5'-phosphate oxidase family protein [Candidatus Woesearchaeota archaeon]